MEITPYHEAMKAARRAYVERALELSRGKVEVAAIICKVRRSYFYRLMQMTGIEYNRRPRRKGNKNW